MGAFLKEIRRFRKVVSIEICVKLHRLLNGIVIHPVFPLDFANFLNARIPENPIVIKGRRKFLIGAMIYLLKNNVVSPQVADEWGEEVEKLGGLSKGYVKKHCYTATMTDNMHDTQTFINAIAKAISEESGRTYM